MRVSFSGIYPSTLLAKELGRLGFLISDDPFSEIKCCFFSQLSDLATFQALGSQSGPTFFVFITSSSCMNEDKLKDQLLLFPFPYVLCPQDSWETFLLLHLGPLKKMIDSQMRLSRSEAELHELNLRTTDLIRKFESDLELAAQIQRSLIPSSQVNVPGILIHSKYLPASGLGGDYFDIFELNEKNQIGLLMADSETHGMAAALLSALLKIRMEEFRHSNSMTQQLVKQLSDEIASLQGKKSGVLDFFFGVLNRATLQLEFTSAGLLRPLLWSGGKLVELPTAPNPSLGLNQELSFCSSSYQFKPGDFFFLHSNGLRAAFAAEGKTIDEGLSTLLKKNHSLDPLEFQSDLLAHINQFKEAHEELPDDVTWIQVLIDHKALYLAQSK